MCYNYIERKFKYNYKGCKIMKKKIKKFIAIVCVATTMCSMAAISSSALTRRLYGDVNGDGVISNADAILTQKYTLGTETFDKYQKIAADVDGDGTVGLADAIVIQKLLAGLITEFPVGECFYY